ncbi:MAG: Holliday junction branch migration protein RuvA [Oscillospiraceae bacterium]|nr:Holliday junction branch migration protein RuvA [Oscillospiraceae bacterium]
MIHCLNGVIISKRPEEMVISCSGVGFRVFIPASVYAATGKARDEVFLFTHLAVKEDAFELYGFLSEEELLCFKMLTGVSGIGPRSGLSVMSLYTPPQVEMAIASGDYKAFAACSGIGQKLAQRIVLELKDKVGTFTSSEAVAVVAAGMDASDSKQEALAALTSLGFSTSESATALAKLPGDLTTEELVSGALKALARR